MNSNDFRCGTGMFTEPFELTEAIRPSASYMREE